VASTSPSAHGPGGNRAAGTAPGRADVAEEPAYGFPAGLWRALERHRPPGVPDARAWRSPLRGPSLTSVFGAILLVALPVVIITGLLDYVAYGPQFGQAIPSDVGLLHLPYFQWPTRPSWLFAVTEGLHVGLGLIIIPVVLAKLWSVVPRLFVWPPVRSPAELLERLSLLLLVGGILFELATGVLNIQYDYLFGFSFYTAHYYGGWVFIAGFLTHVAFKLPRLVSSLRSRSLRTELATSRAQTRPEPRDVDGLVALEPAAPTVSRRGALALVGGGSLLVPVVTVGQSIGGVARPLALLLPRGRSYVRDPTPSRSTRRRWRHRFPRRTPALAEAHPGWRGETGHAGQGHAAGHGPAQRKPAHRLRRGLVDDPDLDRGAAARPRGTGRRP